MHSMVQTYTMQRKLQCLDEINKDGGFNGYQVQDLECGDDIGDPKLLDRCLHNDLL